MSGDFSLVLHSLPETSGWESHRSVQYQYFSVIDCLRRKNLVAMIPLSSQSNSFFPREILRNWTWFMFSSLLISTRVSIRLGTQPLAGASYDNPPKSKSWALYEWICFAEDKAWWASSLALGGKTLNSRAKTCEKHFATELVSFKCAILKFTTAKTFAWPIRLGSSNANYLAPLQGFYDS